MGAYIARTGVATYAPPASGEPIPAEGVLHNAFDHGSALLSAGCRLAWTLAGAPTKKVGARRLPGMLIHYAAADRVWLDSRPC
jgi:hypothetical protein